MIAEQKADNPTLVDKVVESIFQRIIGGDYSPGQKLTEEQIAAEFGVSRTPVREAVKRLADLGLLIVRPRSGLEVTLVSRRDVEEVLELREELESFALRLAMPRIGRDDIGTLEGICRRCESLLGEDNRLRVFREDSRFHLAIARLSGNGHLHELLRRLDVKVQLCRMFLCQSDGKIADNVRFHRRILTAIKQKNAARAETLLRRHINQVWQ